jgi:hypothetical protein
MTVMILNDDRFAHMIPPTMTYIYCIYYKMNFPYRVQRGETHSQTETNILITWLMCPSPINAHQKYRPGMVSFSNQLIAPGPSGTNMASVIRCGLSA